MIGSAAVQGRPDVHVVEGRALPRRNTSYRGHSAHRVLRHAVPFLAAYAGGRLADPRAPPFVAPRGGCRAGCAAPLQGPVGRPTDLPETHPSPPGRRRKWPRVGGFQCSPRVGQARRRSAPVGPAARSCPRTAARSSSLVCRLTRQRIDCAGWLFGESGVRRSEHHQRRPPPPVGSASCHHLALRAGAAHHRQQQLKALPLVNGNELLLTDPDHRAGRRTARTRTGTAAPGCRSPRRRPASRSRPRPRT